MTPSEEAGRHALFPDTAMNPGGSGMLADFDFAVGGELSSRTHCGGGGAAMFDSYPRSTQTLCDTTARSCRRGGVEER
tara:strand:- start:236 stop:469 length:234 start_codon:yes stop_codon:yes gene_type:complete